MDNQLQTLVEAFGASINLDFHGIGADSVLNDHPLTYNLAPVGGIVRGKYRIHRSRTWIGLGYTYFSTDVSFDAPEETPGLPGFNRTSRVGGLTPSLTFDSRDSIFTPSRGRYLEGGASVYGKWLGGDGDFQSAYVVAIQYVSIHRTLVLGVRGDANLSFGRQPFYMRPYIDMRGVPAMQYQGEHAAQLQAELRWQFWKRFSLVGFVGEGIAWIDLDRFTRQRTVTAGGTGFRYELARRYKLHMGVDVAFSQDGTAFYLQFVSPRTWHARPAPGLPQLVARAHSTIVISRMVSGRAAPGETYPIAPGVEATNATTSSSDVLTGGGSCPAAILRCQYTCTSTMPCFSTSAENWRLTGDWTDWSTGTTTRPSPHFSACLRKIALSTERGIWLPFTSEWTITRKAAAAETPFPAAPASAAATRARRRRRGGRRKERTSMGGRTCPDGISPPWG